MCICVCGFERLSTETSAAEEGIVFPEKKFQGAVTHPQTLRRTELQSFAREACVRGHLAVSPAPTHGLFPVSNLWLPRALCPPAW